MPDLYIPPYRKNKSVNKLYIALLKRDDNKMKGVFALVKDDHVVFLKRSIEKTGLEVRNHFSRVRRQFLYSNFIKNAINNRLITVEGVMKLSTKAHINLECKVIQNAVEKGEVTLESASKITGEQRRALQSKIVKRAMETGLLSVADIIQFNSRQIKNINNLFINKVLYGSFAKYFKREKGTMLSLLKLQLNEAEYNCFSRNEMVTRLVFLHFITLEQGLSLTEFQHHQLQDQAIIQKILGGEMTVDDLPRHEK